MLLLALPCSPSRWLPYAALHAVLFLAALCGAVLCCFVPQSDEEVVI